MGVGDATMVDEGGGAKDTLSRDSFFELSLFSLIMNLILTVISSNYRSF